MESLILQIAGRFCTRLVRSAEDKASAQTGGTSAESQINLVLRPACTLCGGRASARIGCASAKPRTSLLLHSACTIFVDMMEFLETYHLVGIVVGAATFLIIGVFHPFVIKGEYYFGVRCWWAFAVSGVAALAASLWVENLILSILLAVWGASSLWGIGELFEQRERVAKGWFPKREKKNRRGGR